MNKATKAIDFTKLKWINDCDFDSSETTYIHNRNYDFSIRLEISRQKWKPCFAKRNNEIKVQHEAICNLVTASPDLLKALVLLVFEAGKMVDKVGELTEEIAESEISKLLAAINNARCAIAKSKGY